MHISVYTEAFDDCIHRIVYLNKYKKKSTLKQQKPNEVHKATKDQKKNLCPLFFKKFPFDIVFISCYNSNPTYWIPCHKKGKKKKNQYLKKHKKQKDLHTLQQSSLKLPKIYPIIDRSLLDNENVSRVWSRLAVRFLKIIFLAWKTRQQGALVRWSLAGTSPNSAEAGWGWTPLAAAYHELLKQELRDYVCEWIENYIQLVKSLSMCK